MSVLYSAGGDGGDEGGVGGGDGGGSGAISTFLPDLHHVRHITGRQVSTWHTKVRITRHDWRTCEHGRSAPAVSSGKLRL